MPPDLNHVSRETEKRLRTYQTLLLKWQEKINLISPNTVRDSWVRHFEDSLQILPLLPEDAISLYDLGCGAGFPGMALAIARKDLSVTLIESDSKKCAFLTTVSRETGVKPNIVNERIEKAAQNLSAPDVVTARALANLTELLDLCGPWISQNAALSAIFPKGSGWKAEVEAANQAGWTFDLGTFPSLTEPEARLLRLVNIAKSRG